MTVNSINSSYAKEAQVLSTASVKYDNAMEKYADAQEKGTPKEIAEADRERRKAEMSYSTLIEVQKARDDIRKRLTQMING